MTTYSQNAGKAGPAWHKRNAFDATDIAGLIQYWAKTRPDHTAFRFLRDGEVEEGALSFSELDQRARDIAALLLLALKPGDRALLAYPVGLDFITAFFGCLYCGVVAVPVYPATRPADWPRFENIALDAGVSVILTTTARLKTLKNLFASIEQPRLSMEIPFVATDEIKLGSAAGSGLPVINPGDLAFLQYTSGSTGSPKGVMVSHANLMHNQWMIKRIFGHTDQTVFVGWVPLYHDMGLIGNVMQPLYLGIPSILMSPAAFVVKPVRWLQAITDYGATTSGGPNFAYELCVRRVSEEQMAGLDLSSWEIAFNGSEMIRASTLTGFTRKFSERGFRRSAFLCCYGMAETTLLVSGIGKLEDPPVLSIDGNALQRNIAAPAGSDCTNVVESVSCGRSDDLEVVIADPVTCQSCAPDQIGEIWVKGGSIAQGYWGKPDISSSVFNAVLSDTGEGRFLRTGDLGFIRNNHVYVTGRCKDLIIIRGRNYYPTDIEAIVQEAHQGFRGGSAAFSTDVCGEEALVVVQEVDRVHARGIVVEDVAGNVRLALSARLGLPLHELVLVRQGKVPKTSSGKIRRSACRAAYLDGTLDIFRQVDHKGAGKHASPQNTEQEQQVIYEFDN